MSFVVSFRLNDEDCQIFEALLLPGETLNQCIRRIALNAVKPSVDKTVDMDVNQPVDKSVDNVYNSVDTINDEVLVERLASIISSQVQAEIEAHLGDLVNNLIDANLPVALGNFIAEHDALALLNRLREYPKFKKLNVKDVEVILSLLRGDS